MGIQQRDYEQLLAKCSSYQGALTLLRQHRPYLEMLPSMRRPQESIVTIPLPNIRVRRPVDGPAKIVAYRRSVEAVPCDLAMLMCDPQWKIKTGVDVVLFIHRPDEEFSELLLRWRQTQTLLSETYEWVMPTAYDHMLNEGGERPYPLFIVFPQTPEHILLGLQGAGLPAVVFQTSFWSDPEEKARLIEPPRLESDELTDIDDGALQELQQELGIDLESAEGPEDAVD